jgi:ABC-type polysaccharide/polyol phosphate export permease
VLANLVKTQLTTRYHRSSLGFVWTLLHPMLLLSVQAVVFSQVFGMKLSEFVAYLFAGMVAWQFFATGMDLGSRSLIIHEGLLRKVAVPKFVCVLAELIGGAINLVFATVAIFVILFTVSQVGGYFGSAVGETAGAVVGGGRFADKAPLNASTALHSQLIIFPVAAVLLLGFLFGVALIGMTLVTWFRDFEHMLSIVLTAMYFSIPIMYPRTFVPDHVMVWLKLNPVFHHVSLFQHALALGTWPDTETWVWAVTSTVVAGVAGYVTYKVFEDDYIYRL